MVPGFEPPPRSFWGGSFPALLVIAVKMCCGVIPPSLGLFDGPFLLPGYIGLEFSDVYTALGSEVTFIEAMDTMMPTFDPGTDMYIYVYICLHLSIIHAYSYIYMYPVHK